MFRQGVVKLSAAIKNLVAMMFVMNKLKRIFTQVHFCNGMIELSADSINYSLDQTHFMTRIHYPVRTEWKKILKKYVVFYFN